MSKVYKKREVLTMSKYAEKRFNDPYYGDVEDKPLNEKQIEKSGVEKGQSMTVNQIVKKYGILQESPLGKKVYFDTEIGLNEFLEVDTKHLDLVDYHRIEKELQLKQQEWQSIQDEEKRKQEEAEFKTAVKAEIERLKSEGLEDLNPNEQEQTQS